MAAGDFSKYMKAEYEDGKLRVFTLDEFENYELQETAVVFQIELQFACTDGSKILTFFQTIKAVNNFEPEFTLPSYEIEIPLPLPKGLDITMFMIVNFEASN